MEYIQRKHKLLAEIKERQIELEDIERELYRNKELTPVQQLAVGLHDTLCKYNHIDGCSWHYEITDNVHNWDRREHRSELKKAEVLTEYLENNDITHEDVFTILGIVSHYY